MSLPSPQLPTRPVGPTDRESQLLKAVRERDATACSRLVRQWVHRHGTASLDSFTEITVTLHEGPEARDWLLLQLSDPFPTVAPIVAPAEGTVTADSPARSSPIPPAAMVVEPEEEEDEVPADTAADVPQPSTPPPLPTAAEEVFTSSEPPPTPQPAPSPMGPAEGVIGSGESGPEPDPIPPLKPAVKAVAASPIAAIPSQTSGSRSLEEQEQGRPQEAISSQQPGGQQATDPWALPSLADLGFGSQDFSTGPFSTAPTEDITPLDGGDVTEAPAPTSTAQAGVSSPLTRGWASLRQVRSSLRNWFTDTMESLRDEDLPIEDASAREKRADADAGSGEPGGQGLPVGFPLPETSFLDSSFPPLGLPLGDLPPASADTGHAFTPPTTEAEQERPSDQGTVHPRSPTLPPVGPPAPAPPALNDLRAWLPDADSGTGLPKAS